jgi:hypothetical protein
LGQTLATLKTNVACSLWHEIENILFHDLNDDWNILLLILT